MNCFASKFTIPYLHLSGVSRSRNTSVERQKVSSGARHGEEGRCREDISTRSFPLQNFVLPSGLLDFPVTADKSKAILFSNLFCVTEHLFFFFFLEACRKFPLFSIFLNFTVSLWESILIHFTGHWVSTVNLAINVL